MFENLGLGLPIIDRVWPVRRPRPTINHNCNFILRAVVRTLFDGDACASYGVTSPLSNDNPRNVKDFAFEAHELQKDFTAKLEV